MPGLFGLDAADLLETKDLEAFDVHDLVSLVAAKFASYYARYNIDSVDPLEVIYGAFDSAGTTPEERKVRLVRYLLSVEDNFFEVH